MWPDPSHIDPQMDSRAITFENPTGARGAGGTAHGGRKGAPSRTIQAGERVTLADIEGPGTIRHIWMTFPRRRPERMRALSLDVFYDGLDEPSISVPCLDFFGLPHGRTAPYASMLTSAQEGRGFNAYFPMPFQEGVRIELTNHSDVASELYYQVDYTLGDCEASYLHVSFRRENPTVMKRDYVISEGLRGPGRFLGCVVGVRTIDEAMWYGEGEVKIYRDGDDELPTICGTGLEDYVGSAWGLGVHHAPFAGAPIEARPESAAMPDFVGFYRWHVPDPVMFERDLRVTIQQIGAAAFLEGQEEALEKYKVTNPVAGRGWIDVERPGVLAWGICERVDDYCSADFVYCREPQAVPRLGIESALADIQRRGYE